jgi:hypothetical protein
MGSALGRTESWKGKSVLGRFLGVLTQSADCTGNDVIQVVREHCGPTATGSSIVIRLCSFVSIHYTAGENGGGIYVSNSNYVVEVRGDSFFNCTAQDHGGGVYLQSVRAGTSIIDSCACQCAAYGGAFATVRSVGSAIGVVFQGLSVVACPGVWGAVSQEHGVQGKVSECNFTKVVSSLAAGPTAYWAAALNQGGDYAVSTNATFLLFVGCDLGKGCWHSDEIGPAFFQSCSFVDNPIAALALWEYWSQVLVRMCYFKGTDVVQNWNGQDNGVVKVTLDDCLFAGEVPTLPTRAALSGVQVSFTTTEMSFNTASLLPIGRGATDIFEETRVVWNDVVDDVKVITERALRSGLS